MRQGKHFTEQVDQLITEIEFALQWEGPIIMLAIYRSAHVFEDAEASLSTYLAALDQELIPIRVRSDSANIAGSIAERRGENRIYSIADLSLGGGDNDADAYRALNLHREYFIDENIRCIVWLTEKEARQLSLIAPDFWAFRHRVVDLIGERATPKRSTSFQGLTWIEWPWHIFENDFDAALAYRDEMLRELPDQPETIQMRVNLFGEIAGLFVQQEDWEGALDTIKQGITGLPENTFPELEAPLYIGLAIILIQLEDYEQAYAALEKADSLGLDTEHFLVLLAQGKRLLGRRSDALDDINKAIRRDPGLASAWNECGNIYADLGRITQAQKAYQKAIEHSSDQVQPLLNMSALLASINRLDEALKLIKTAQIDQKIDLRKFMNKRGFEFLEQLR